MQDGSNQLAAPVLAAPLLEQRRPSDGGSTSALDGDARQPSVARRWSNRRHRKLGVVSVAMIVFFNVSGGPIVSEQVVTYGGPFVGLGAMGSPMSLKHLAAGHEHLVYDLSSSAVAGQSSLASMAAAGAAAASGS